MHLQDQRSNSLKQVPYILLQVSLANSVLHHNSSFLVDPFPNSHWCIAVQSIATAMKSSTLITSGSGKSW